MMNKLATGFLFMVLFVVMVVVSGCSKREQTMVGLSVVSATTAGASFLKGHCKRNGKRKQALTHYKYHKPAEVERCRRLSMD